jgi:hypothetical protein
MHLVLNSRTRRMAALPIAVALLAVMPLAAQAAPEPSASRLADRTLEPAARGVVTFENTANVASYQQDGIFTYKGWQYTGFYRADRTAVISRRKLPNGSWQSIELDYKLFSDDSHNTVAMAVTPSDGRIHLAFPTHADQIRYTRSVPGIADKPSQADWSSRSFERTRGFLPGAPDAPVSFTYPQFEMVHGRMLLTYRDGSSNNGRQALLRYDDNADGTWTFLGRFTSSTGTYTSPFGTSTSRYGYLHGFNANPVTGDLEISFSWREQGSAWCHPAGLGNHDLGYARSPDGGFTWLNNDGLQIGTTALGAGNDRISVTDPHVVVPIPINTGLINQETQAFDREGRLHVMTSQFNAEDLAKLGGCHTSTYSQRAQYAKPFHHWRDASGEWHTMELPFYNGSSGRTKLLFDNHDTAFVVLPDARIAAATAESGWRDWRLVFGAEDVDNVSELIYDRQRLERDGVLSVAYQETSSPANAPSAYRVADFRIDGQRPDRPKAVEPEAPPVPYSGSAPTFPMATASSSQPAFPPDLAVDGSTATFWVSGGTTPADSPTPEKPETLTIEYGRTVAVRHVTVVPRVNWGPRAFAIEARVGGAWQRLAEVTQANAAATHLVPRVDADALRLVITGTYDGQFPPNTGNVQIAEVRVSGDEP